MPSENVDYYLARAAEECALAADAADPIVRNIHLQLAAHYMALVDDAKAEPALRPGCGVLQTGQRLQSAYSPLGKDNANGF